MNAYVALCRREWLEHRNAFVLGPAILIALLLVSILIAFIANDNVQVDLGGLDRSEIEERVDLDDLEATGALDIAAAAALDVAGSTDAELENKLDKLLNAVAVPFHWVLMVVTFFALLGSLFDERKDHSILFWKSLPVTSAATVLSKFAFIAILAPMITVLGIFLAQFTGLLVSSAFVEDGMVGRVWSASYIWLRPLDFVLGYVVYAFWALPVYAWVMLVSVYVTRAPGLIALGVPLVASYLEGMIFKSGHLLQAIADHLTPRSLPLANLADESQVIGYDGFTPMLNVLGNVSFWAGLVLGFALLSLTIYFRDRRNEF